MITRVRTILCWMILTGLVVGLFSDIPVVRSEPSVTVVHFKTTRELEQYYEKIGYDLEGIRRGRYVVVEEFPDDFHKIRHVPRKKRLFQRILLPLIYLENQRLLDLRSQVTSLRKQWTDRGGLNARQEALIRTLLVDYEIIREERQNRVGLTDERFRELLQRIHRLPPSMVLAQAANESGWGTSRFTRQANNLFGQYTYGSGGMKPRAASNGSNHRIRVFPDLRSSVRSYMHNLNSGWAYKQLRTLRTRQDGSMNSLELVKGLSKYSEKGKEYVRVISRMIRHNNYRRFDRF